MPAPAKLAPFPSLSNSRLSKPEVLGLSFLLVIFTCFTWRGVTMFFSGDDMLNMHFAWNTNPWLLARAVLFLWEPVYRPVGNAIYRVIYAVFGFHPLPLYTLCWLLLAANVLVGYSFFRAVTSTAAEALTALSLVLVHGSFSDLYYSAGTIYDRLCFLFTAAGLAAYFRFRRRPDWRSFALVCLLAILAMGSKESGVALFPLILCAEIVFFGGARASPAEVRPSPRRLIPLFATLAALSLIFVFGRVGRDPNLVANPAYAPHPSLTLWLTHVAEYLSILTYNRIVFTLTTAAAVLAGMALAAIATRNRTMIFGWLFFIVGITPVALIASRAGYVLYLPDLGLGLFFAAAIARATAPLTRVLPRAPAVTFLLVTFAVTWLHVRHWPPAWDKRLSPEFRLTDQFRRDYPSLPPRSKLLFVTDEFPKPAYDLQFNLWLLYHDQSIVAYRLQGAPEQRPDPHNPPAYDHIFTAESGHYAELDPRNPAESIRLHILRGYEVQGEMDMVRPDHSAYVVFGLKDGEARQPSYWTDPRAEFKFQLQAQPKVFTAKFWLPDYVAKPNRTLSVRIDGIEIGKLPLDKEGMNQVSLAVPANLIHEGGYTLVQMNVENPYRDANGAEYGVVLFRAGFAD